MGSVPNATAAAERARWLAELAQALDEARRLVKCLGAAENRIDAAELHARIEVVLLEVQVLRSRGNGSRLADANPEWMKMPPWQRRV